jgi:hypothetical protein
VTAARVFSLAIFGLLHAPSVDVAGVGARG